MAFLGDYMIGNTHCHVESEDPTPEETEAIWDSISELVSLAMPAIIKKLREEKTA